MRLFIDSANTAEIHAALSLGCVSGITTNPALVAKEPPHPGGYYTFLRELIRDTKSQDAPFSVQPYADDLRASPNEHLGIIKGALQSRGLIVKIAASSNNLRLMRLVASTGTPVNATCIFTVEQAIASILAGAKYVSLFWGRINDAANLDSDATVGSKGGITNGGEEAEKSARRVRELIDRSNLPVQIIAGSIRTPEAAMRAFAAGCHIVTTKLSVIEAMANSPLSTESAQGFDNARKSWDERSSALNDLLDPESSGPLGQVQDGAAPAP